MSERWFFAWQNYKFGPFTASELKELAKSGRLQPTDTVWKEGVVAGVIANQVGNLFPGVSPKVCAREAHTPTAPAALASQPTSNASAHLESVPPSANPGEVSIGQRADILPERLTLRAIEGTDDSVFLASPWTKSALTNSPLTKSPQTI